MEGDVPEIHGDGEQTRDYIYVEDTVDIALKTFPIISPGESVNISTGQQLSIKYVVDTIVHVMNYNGNITRKPQRTADVQSHRASTEKLQTLIGQYDKTPFKKGITDTVSWVKTEKERKET